jgi:very-short-patch-repair endonuclease
MERRGTEGEDKKMMNNHYNKDLKESARKLRKQSVSKAEKLLWRYVLSRNQMGVKFKRQRPIDKFIVDFFSEEINLIIEIDGSSHLHKGNYDKHRQNKLEDLGYSVLRLNEGEVLESLDEVLRKIDHTIYSLKMNPPPVPPSKGGAWP